MPSPQVIDKLKSLQEELEKISFAVKHFDEAAKVGKSASEILKQIPELIKELRSVEVNHRNELQKLHKEKIDEVAKQLTNLLTELREKSKQLSQVTEETKKVEKAITDFFTEIKKINFPERLNKIDNQISSINIGVGNLQTAIQISQTKIDAVNSALNEANKSIEKKQTDYQNILLQRLNNQDKEIKLLKTVLFLICAMVIIETLVTILVLK